MPPIFSVTVGQECFFFVLIIDTNTKAIMYGIKQFTFEGKFLLESVWLLFFAKHLRVLSAAYDCQRYSITRSCSVVFLSLFILESNGS